MIKCLDGKKESQRLLGALAKRIKKSKQKITLATILVGDRYDSALYVKLKRRAAAVVGIKTEFHHLPAKTSQTSLRRLITSLNRRRPINGILLQLPLPAHLNADRAIKFIDPRKDADGFHPTNKLVVPPPVAAVLRLIDMAKLAKHGLVVILGKPSVLNMQLADILTGRHYQVVITAPKKTIPAITRHADIIITAMGHGPLLGARHIKRGVIIVDVGIRQSGHHTTGDVAPSAWTKAKALSPVPGGVGPLTVAYLLLNTYKLAIKS